MRWYALGLLAVVIGWVVAFETGWLLAGEPLPPSPITPSHEDVAALNMQARGVHLVEHHATAKVWELFAKDAVFYETQHLAVIHHVRAHFFQWPTTVWQLTAESGQIDRATGNMTLQGNVQLQSSAGYTMQTENLQWAAVSRLLSTPAQVELRGPSMHIVGIGLVSDVQQQRFTLQRRVRASFR